MKGREFKAEMNFLGWSQAEFKAGFGRRINTHANTVTAWPNDKPSISGPALAYLRLAVSVKGMTREVLG